MHAWFLFLGVTSLAGSVNAPNIELLRPLRMRTDANEGVEIMVAALKKGADINVQMPDTGQTPLMHAVLTGQEMYVKFILSRNPNVTIAEKDGYTPMHGAAFQGRYQIAQLLLHHGVPHTPEDKDWHKDGYAPLHRACWGFEKRHARTIEVLLRAGADPELKSREPNGGKTPIEMCQSSYCRTTLTTALKKAALEKKKKARQEENEKHKEKMKYAKKKRRELAADL
eukprot:GEMP01042775.1.p1 GENE.GEMP01042775.1~~GEMP01042775.1.p1  ORF type:complete len:242 (+),score=65.51 GEMP01042775.1:51-728(+)